MGVAVGPVGVSSQATANIRGPTSGSAT
jgi:hypothetical protein